MESIIFQNLSVEGIPYQHIDTVMISQGMNEHSTAVVKVNLSESEAKDFINRTTSMTGIKIKTTAEGQNPVLFTGYISSQEMTQTKDDYVQLSLELISYSKKLDIQKIEKTFQNQSLTYGDIISQTISKEGSFVNMVNDQVTGCFIFQYNETDWEFCKRMASRINASLFVDCTTEKPLIYAGFPGRKSYSENNPQMENTSTGVGGIQTICIVSNQYVLAGDQFTINNQKYYVSKCFSEISMGVLKTHIELIRKETHNVLPASNPSFSGRMFVGQVQAVEKDKVQVFFTGIDSSYDSGGSTWFPFSTSYSSSDGSGFYCMPEVGDTVRVFMPSSNEKDAFVASAVNNNPGENTRDKSWKAPGGKEILLTDEGIFIICENEKIYINLTSTDGITIESSKPISFMTEANISLTAGGEVTVDAKNRINLQVGESAIEMTTTDITLGADEVHIN